MENVVAGKILRVDGSVIEGRVTNKTAHRVRRPELVATYSWLWHDDHHPGDNDPGWVAYAVVPDDLGLYKLANFARLVRVACCRAAQESDQRQCCDHHADQAVDSKSH